MSRQKDRKFKPGHKQVLSKSTPVGTVSQQEAQQIYLRERYFEFFLIAALLSFGVYQSVLYFGHKVVPISDFPDIVSVGHRLLSFKLPFRFMQAPVVGILQALLSHLVGGQNPDLCAGWLLNAILHPLNLVLFWCVGKRIMGRAESCTGRPKAALIEPAFSRPPSVGGGSALWFAIIAIINPWVIYMLTEPIIETPLLFFSLVTFYFIFKRSKLAYVFASIATVVRYEGASLIMAAFVIDLFYSENRRQRIHAVLYSVLATVPLALWLLGTFLAWKPGSSHYLEVLFSKEYAKGFAQPVGGRTGILLHMRLLWLVGFRPLLMPYPGASEAFVEMLWKLSQTIAIASFFFGSVYGLCKRRWEILVLLLFFVPYFLLHAFYPYPLQRFHSTIFWIATLICLFGLQSVWKLIDRNGLAPRALVVILQIVVAVISVLWLVSLISYLPKISAVSPRSVRLPYVAMFLTGLIFAGRLYVYKFRNFLRELSILVFVCLIIVSNQFTLVGLIGDGQQDKEFKLLADWFVTNARPGEKMGVYMAGIVKMFAPKVAEYIVGLPKTGSPEEFVKACYDQNITYVVWATREGAREDHTGYRQAGLHENIKQLATPKNTGPYQFVTQVGSERGYVNIFRLQPSSSGADTIKPASGSS
jgi:hypothetical protein